MPESERPTEDGSPHADRVPETVDVDRLAFELRHIQPGPNGADQLGGRRKVSSLTRGRAGLIAVILFIVTRVGLGFFVPPTTCRDGWPSPSIGHRGACSWHGGVGGNWWALLATAGAIGLAAYVYFKLLGPVERREDEEYQQRSEQLSREREEAAAIIEAAERPRKELARKYGISCPSCAAPMTIRLARRGRNAGKEFLGWSRYPSCFGTKPIEAADAAALRRRIKEFQGELERHSTSTRASE